MRLSKRGAATVFHLSKKFFSTRATAVPRRLVPAFFCLLIVAGVVIPPVSAYAAEQSVSAADPNKTMSQDYAGPLQSAGSTAGAAADAKPSGVVNQFNKSNTSSGSPVQSIPVPATYKAEELPEKRTATSDVTRNKDGSLTKKNYFSSKYYQKDGKWQSIDTKLMEDKNAGDSGNVLGKAYGFVQSLVSSPTDFTVKNNDWQARFSPSNSPKGMVRVKKGNSQIGFVPQNAKKVAPVITTDKSGKQTVHYYDLWPGVNVEYVVLSDQVKENIVIKNKNAANKVSFKVTGASLKAGKASKTKNAAYEVKGALNDEFRISPSNLILNNFGFVSQGSGLKQEYKNGVLSVSVDKSYLKNLPDKAFPAVIDPGVYRSNIGDGYGNNYVSFKSDGYVCYSNECDLYSGGLYDSNWYLQYWRGAYFAPYEIFQQNPHIRLKNANLHLTQLTNTGYWTGTYNSHTFYAGHATCLSFNCLEGDSWNAAGTVSTSGNIDVTNIYQAMISRGDYGAWIMLGGEDGTDSSFKDFDPNNSYVDFTYVDLPPAPSFAAPVSGQVYVDPQASFKINPATNPNNGTALQYELMVSSSPGGAGTVISSGMINGQQWTIPDGILQDGSTYYVQARSYDPENALYGSWGGSVSFRIDSREGKDKTQTYDTLGPVSIDLATGNLTTSASSHTSSALGGSLGISLDYNSPLKSRIGLVGQYWPVAAGYSGNTIPSTSPSVERVDQSVDFNWAYDSPQPGTVTNDWFFGRWTGYFVAPSTGTYYFGGRNDDRLFVYVDGQEVYANGGCYGDVCYGSNGVNLTAGQIVPFKAEYKEETGAAFTHVYVKGAVSEQIIPQDWFRTGVRPKAQNHGLTGHYYTDDGSHNLDSTTKTQFLARMDSILSFNWGTGAPVAGAPADSYMARWTGYVTAPVSGTYYFGMKADDGSRVTVNNVQVEENWALGGYDTKYGSSISLSAGQTVPITVDYFENIGNAYAGLYVKGAVPEQVVPSGWLSPSANVLPDGWNLGIDPDGSLNYDHIKVNQNSVVLTDSTGSTHEYTWTGSAYKPPVNEDGQLSRNADGTFTMQDTDGKTYIFGSDGMLVSVTTPTDDLKPAALKYTYSGTPARITQITDGVDAGRYAKIYYSGDSQCSTPPAGFDTQAPAGMLCAVQTNDGRTTNFYYKDKQLARIAKPGNEYLDYQYQPVTDASGATVAYRMSAIRDSLANDAIAAGVRTNDDTVLTQISYDATGRATTVTAPSPSPTPPAPCTPSNTSPARTAVPSAATTTATILPALPSCLATWK